MISFLRKIDRQINYKIKYENKFYFSIFLCCVLHCECLCYTVLYFTIYLCIVFINNIHTNQKSFKIYYNVHFMLGLAQVSVTFQTGCFSEKHLNHTGCCGFCNWDRYQGEIFFFTLQFTWWVLPRATTRKLTCKCVYVTTKSLEAMQLPDVVYNYMQSLFHCSGNIRGIRGDSRVVWFLCERERVSRPQSIYCINKTKI